MEINKLTRGLAAKQIKLLSFQDYFQRDEDLAELLATSLIRHSDDEAHMQRMVATWIERTRQALHPADVPGLAAQTTYRLALPPGCDVCKGDPWLVGDNAAGQACAVRCACARGQKLAEADALKKAEDARRQIVGGVP